MCDKDKTEHEEQYEAAASFPDEEPKAEQTCGASHEEEEKEEPAHLHVYVKEKMAEKKPIPGAFVEVSGPEQREGTTDDEGLVKFLDITPGYYDIMAKKDPYGDEFGSATVPAATTKIAEILLEYPKIVSVEFLDGGDNLELKEDSEHYVNFPVDDKWVENSHIKNKDRLGHKPRFKVRFNKEGIYTFTVSYKPGDDNSQYSGTEEGISEHYKYQKEEKLYQTGEDGTNIIEDDFFVAAAGGDTYQLVAYDDMARNKVKSHVIEIFRMIYIQEIKMKTVGAAASLATVIQEFAKYKIRLSPLIEAEMDHIPNIGVDSSDFKTKARTAYTGSSAPDKEPYVLAIAYTDMLAVKDSSKSLTSAEVEVGPGKAVVNMDIYEIDAASGDAKWKFLWKDIVPGEGWFVSAKFNGTKIGDPTVAVNEDIAEAKCTAKLVSPGNVGHYGKVEIDVTGLTAAKGTITLTVDWVNRMRGGLAFGDNNAICVCTKAWWKAITTAEQCATMIHEIGHQIGMVPDGTKLDKPTSFYDSSKGHVGTHCHFDIATGQARYDSDADGKNAKCVMYGSDVNGVNEFCEECIVSVKKTDFCDGWTRF